MSASDAGPDPQPEHHDPMAADRRVLVLGLVAMLLLVGIGVGSAALFATSACGDIGPDPRPGGASTTGLTDLAAEGGIEPGHAADLESLAGALSARFGDLRDVAVVAPGGALAAVDGGVAAIGALTTVLGPESGEVRASAAFDDPARVVGDGEQLFSLAYINPLTGQVDALLPLDGDLAAGTCIDTAVIGEPFAFHLDAGGGELLLFRVEEDADAPQLELRDGVEGRRWTADLPVPVAPPGILAERVTAVLGEEQVVAARRVIPGEQDPAVLAVSRNDGSGTWQVTPDRLLGAIDEPQWLTPVALGAGVAVVAVAAESDRDRAELVALGLDDGGLRWSRSPSDEPVALEAVEVHAGQVWSAWLRDGEVILTSQDVRDGAVLGTQRLDGEAPRLRAGLAATSAALVELVGAGRSTVLGEAPQGWRFADVLPLPGGGLALLVEGDDDALLLRFG